jgi:hypothetical protein
MFHCVPSLGDLLSCHLAHGHIPIWHDTLQSSFSYMCYSSLALLNPIALDSFIQVRVKILQISTIIDSVSRCQQPNTIH